jgi:DNA-binding CsgD family transcriptional regulator
MVAFDVNRNGDTARQNTAETVQSTWTDTPVVVTPLSSSIMRTVPYDHLIRAIYDGILAVDGWHNVLREMRSLTNSEQDVLLLLDRRSDVVLVGEAFGVDPAQVEDYESNYAPADPGKLFIDKIAIGDWYFDVRDTGMGIIRSHGFYQEFMRKHGLQSIMWTPLMAAGPVHAALSFQAGLNRPPFNEEDARTVEPLLPHLVRAVALRWRFQDLSRLAQLGQHLLDRLQSPVLVIDAKARILFANTAGQNWLSSKRHTFSCQSTLQPVHLWPQLLRLASQICGRDPVAVATMKIGPTGGEAPTYLVGLPLREDHPIAQTWSQPIGLVVVHDFSVRPAPWPELLRQLFALTPAECRLVEKLAEHHSIGDAAETLGVGRETVRSQLKSVFQKTGSRNQSALIQMITELSQLHGLEKG